MQQTFEKDGNLVSGTKSRGFKEREKMGIRVLERDEIVVKAIRCDPEPERFWAIYTNTHCFFQLNAEI